MDCELVKVNHCEYGIQMHECTSLRDVEYQYPLKCGLVQHVFCKSFDGSGCRSLAQSDCNSLSVEN